MKILKVDSSTNGGDSVSRELTDMIVEKLKSDNPDADIVTRDLGTEPLAHLNPITTGAIRMGEDDWTDDMKPPPWPRARARASGAATASSSLLSAHKSADTSLLSAS